MSSQTAPTAGLGLGVIEPKLLLPRIQPGMLRRSGLLEMIDDDGGVALTMVNAPAGYGKTTLLRSWCTERSEAVVWMTLDAADDDPMRLWTHLATAVERLGEGLGRAALMCLGVRGAPVETAVDELMNGLVAYARPVAIVLDDLHAVGSERSLASIAHAIKRLPANARVLASTRSEPAISVARLRARGALREIRARELAFTVDEAGELIAREGIELSGESIELLVERTEGWLTGLYLAALWLRDLADPDQGVRAFVGSARHIADYLTDEVLSALAPDARDFLLRTSVLGRFTPELCDAVLGREDSAAVLAELARSNMFLVGLDAHGEWYRYHHLFGELLRLELGREDAPVLRRRAAAWCRSHGLVEDAIEYAAGAGDAETVAELLSEHHLEFVWGGRIGQLLGWVRWLDSELLVAHPALPAVGAFAAAILAHPEVEVQQLLAIAEQARRERPLQWSPYVEVEVTRAASIERALLVLAHVLVARSRLERAASILERAQGAIMECPDPGRLPAIAATVERELSTARANAGSRGIVEEPSAAELAVLGCLSTGLSRREIGARLYISLNTVKTHTRELYRKLDATSRAEAVARAEALGLLDLTESPG